MYVYRKGAKAHIAEDGASPPATVDANVASMDLPFGVKKKDVTAPKKSNDYIKKTGNQQKKMTLATLRMARSQQMLDMTP